MDLFYGKLDMDLKGLNSKVYDMWKIREELGPDYFQPSTQEDIAAIKSELGADIPDDYQEFLIEYSTVGGVPKIGAYYFKCAYKSGPVITFNHTLVPWAKLTLTAIRALHYPHRHLEGIGARIPRELLPLSRDNECTILIDLRPATVGQILYIPQIKRQTFGTSGYGWDNIGYVADSFTAFLGALDTEKNLVAKYSLPVE
ncbi:SMI1/KNR4 family protein [Sinorhizobium americanum]|uniref:SMI1/KNR4 family protein n=1 Tax=Sinorhizobium americanum TaxID=194963 RepID=UPI0009FA4CA9|nr:SMI1/KNR4 family protein [Sinorhizobium americanum]